MPGSGHLLSGQTLYLKLRDGNTIDDLLIHNADGSIAGGIKMANGTNPQRNPPFPGTRAKSAAMVREQFVKAQEYRDRTYEELRQMELDLRQDLFNLRFQHATGQLDDASRLRQAKRNLARVKTVVREHELGIRKVVSSQDAGGAE